MTAARLARISLWSAIVTLFLIPSVVLAGAELRGYGAYMEPNGQDAEHYSRAGWGGGVRIVAPIPRLGDFLAGTIGLEWINLLKDTRAFRDKSTGENLDQETSQDYYRLFGGGEIGPHGHGLIRPHAGVNLALVYYDIDTDLLVPDEYNFGETVRENVSRESKFALGYDITLGVDLNFANRWSIDGGVRYLKTFGLVQQLGKGSEKIYPEYFQVYLGIGVPFDRLED